jgi:hypothetical protein
MSLARTKHEQERNERAQTHPGTPGISLYGV